MTKKQMGIIFTLLALIVCTALLAGKLNNSGLNDPTDISAVLSEDNKDKVATKSKTSDDTPTSKKSKEKQASSTTDFFYQAINERNQKDASTAEELTNQMENPNIDAATKTQIATELQKLTIRQDKQKTIELNLKNKGYEYSICQISEDDTKADITIKAENIDDTQSALIQEVVENTCGIHDVTIQYIK